MATDVVLDCSHNPGSPDQYSFKKVCAEKQGSASYAEDKEVEVVH